MEERYNIGYNTSDGTFVHVCSIPAEPSGLSPEVFIRFTDLAADVDTGVMTVEQAAVALAMDILGSTPDVFNAKMEENVAFVASLAARLFGLPLSVDANPISEIKIPGEKPVRALGFGFYDASVREYLNFLSSMEHFCALSKAAADDHSLIPDRDSALTDLLCTLYPVPYESSAQNVVRHTIETLTPSVRLHLLRHARASHESLAKGTFTFYTSEISFRDIFCSEGSKSSSSGDGCFADAIVSVAEAGPFGDYEKTLDTNLIIVLRYMQNRYRETKKIKKNVKRK